MATEDDDYEWEEDDTGGEWEEEHKQDDENIQIDENDMNEADFAEDDEFADEFADDDNGGWDDVDDNNAQDELEQNPLSTLLNEENTAKKPVPQETKNALNANIDEINMLPMFCGVPDLTAPAVMLGIKIKQFKGISRDQLAVWGLSDYQYIGVRLKFGRWYLHEIEAPTIEIGACNHVSDVGIELEPFRIAWTLKDRCKNAFLCVSDWHQNIKMNQIPDSSSINDLMETTQKTYAQCLAALRHSKNDATQATELLFNLNDTHSSNKNNKKSKKKKKHKHMDDNIDIRSAEKRFLSVLQEATTKVDPMNNNNATQAQQKKVGAKQYEKASMTQRTKQLAEIYNMKYEAVQLAVAALGYEIASEQLAFEDIRAQYESQVEQDDKSKKNKKNEKKSWWNWNASWNADTDEKYDKINAMDYKMEYKVWNNLKKACHSIDNYERMDDDPWLNVQDDDFKMDLGSDNIQIEIDDQKLSELATMGFDVNKSRNALLKTANADIDVVVEYILQHENETYDESAAILDEDASALAKRAFEKKKQAKERQKRMFALGPCPRLTKTSSESSIHKITTKNEAMEAISLMFEHNFFVIILSYILKQLLNSTENCMICGEPLDYPGLKPTICMSPFCQFRLLEIGLGGGSDGGYGLGAEILGNSDICDFLICCACAAAGNPARSTIFFPEAVRGASSDTADESFMNADNSQNVQKLQQVIALCPAIDNMKGWAREGEWSLKEELGKLHCLLYPYLIWVITSNRALIMKLNDNQLIKEIKTPYQFVMRSQTPERAEQFNQKKKNKGSVFYAWHGSGIFNWHSILRMGLKNYSNTKYMSAGAAYGSGVYCAEHSQTSMGYCTRGAGGMTWKGSKFGSNVCCMALCEIVGPKSAWDKSNGIYVVSDEACVATRYFFLFDSTKGIGSISANGLTLPKIN